MNKQTKSLASLAAMGMSVLLLGAACSTQPNSGTANNEPLVKTEPAKPPSDKGDQVVTGGDLAFMNDAAPGGMAEVEMGRMAAKQAQSSEVKRFAARMIADHTKAGRVEAVGAAEESYAAAGRKPSAQRNDGKAVETKRRGV